MDISVNMFAQTKSIFPDDPSPRCGYGPFHTGIKDPFIRACIVHDTRYGQHDTGLEFELYSRSRADNEFLNNMLRESGDSYLMKTRAYTYYGFVRTFGWLVW